MGFLDRVRTIFGGRGPQPLDPARDDLAVVVEGFDEVEACSAALARATRWRPGEQAVLRHHLVLPTGSVEDASSIAAQDGYAADPPVGDACAVDLVLWRVQVLDALHCSQERSRMAGLAQRLGGFVRGWDGLQPTDDQGTDRSR